ncbi:MAG: ATP-binding protein [Candidatus Coproplasma sp.]
MKRKKNTTALILGTILFFLTFTICISFGILVYVAISKKTQNTAIIATVTLSGIAFLSLTATVIDLLRRKVTVQRPVEEILSATDKIASGDFSARLNISHDYGRYNEFDFIKENLNKMTAELEKTEVLHTDFIANVSHEIKTPLAIIQNYASALQNENLDGETRKKFAQTLVGASGRLNSLVVNILKLNKLENQQLTPEYSVINLNEMLAEAVLSYEEKIDEKGIMLDCDIEEAQIYSCADYLEIVWNNLISNAVKFTEEGGRIGVKLKNTDGKAVVEISDTGCGISAETGKHIFDKFYQGDTSHAKEGNGLGLALVKKVIDLIGGQIFVESELNKGATFKVVINGVK